MFKLLPKRALYKILIFVSFVFLFFYDLRFLNAQEATSPNFRIRGDNLTPAEGSSSSASYGVTADTNPFSNLATSASFRQEVGYNPRIQAFTPYAPLLQNTSGVYYDRLDLIIDSSGNPADTLYAIAVSNDNFTTFQYVQSDSTVSGALGIEDYQDYASWGGVGGFTILGLDPNKTYTARVKALNGDFTETGWGPASAEASTTEPFIRLSISDSEVYFGTLSAHSISQTSGVSITVDTNATSGYQTYINGTGNSSSGGLYNGSNLIVSATSVLSPGTEGYGAQATSATASIDGKYAVSGNNVGSVDVSVSSLSGNSSDILGEVTSVLFKVSISGATEAGEYGDTVYFTVSPSI